MKCGQKPGRREFFAKPENVLIKTMVPVGVGKKGFEAVGHGPILDEGSGEGNGHLVLSQASWFDGHWPVGFSREKASLFRLFVHRLFEGRACLLDRSGQEFEHFFFFEGGAISPVVFESLGDVGDVGDFGDFGKAGHSGRAFEPVSSFLETVVIPGAREPSKLSHVVIEGLQKIPDDLHQLVGLISIRFRKKLNSLKLIGLRKRET